VIRPSASVRAPPDVEDVARVDRDPTDLAGAVQRHDADPRRVGVVPAVGHAPPDQVHPEHHRQVQEHRVPVGDREVVHHRRPGAGHLGAGHQLPGRGQPVVDQVRGQRAVGEEVQVAGVRVALGVGGHGGGQPAVEVARPDRLQLRRDLVRETVLDQREQLPAVLDDVGVGDDGGAVEALGAEERAALQRAGADPAVAVPLRAALPQPHPVDHPVAQEPVPRILPGSGVGPVAEVAPGQLGRQGAVHRQVHRADLVRDRGQVAGQVHRRRGRRHAPSLDPSHSTCQY
jgi:hypothetical protein